MLNALNKSKLFWKQERPEQSSFEIVVLGLSITSSWGNGHAITYRSLMGELIRRGHKALFLERDVPWYSQNRDMPRLHDGQVELYSSLTELQELYSEKIRTADCVIVGSYVPDGIAIGEWVTSTATGVTAFYDIDTPVTVANVELGSCAYINRKLMREYDLYLSFTGGPLLSRIQDLYAVRMPKVLYCSIDPAAYFPEQQIDRWDLGYIGTYSADRQPALNELLIQTAEHWDRGRFVVAGPQYPENISWPRNIERIPHLSQKAHRGFYNTQKFTLNITRADMVKAGYSPSIRLFEAAACGAPIITDYWKGLESIFEIGREILVAESSADVLRYLRDIPDEKRVAIGWNARRRVLREHTAAHRAKLLDEYISEVRRNAVLGEPIKS